MVVKRIGTMDELILKIEISPDILPKELQLREKDLNWATISPETVKEHTVLTALQQRLSKKIKENIGLSIAVELMAPQTIPRSEGGKLSRVVDLRAK
jgi:phenylacetate-CoA ligase